MDNNYNRIVIGRINNNQLSIPDNLLRFILSFLKDTVRHHETTWNPLAATSLVSTYWMTRIAPRSINSLSLLEYNLQFLHQFPESVCRMITGGSTTQQQYNNRQHLNNIRHMFNLNKLTITFDPVNSALTRMSRQSFVNMVREIDINNVWCLSITSITLVNISGGDQLRFLPLLVNLERLRIYLINYNRIAINWNHMVKNNPSLQHISIKSSSKTIQLMDSIDISSIPERISSFSLSASMIGVKNKIVSSMRNNLNLRKLYLDSIVINYQGLALLLPTLVNLEDLALIHIYNPAKWMHINRHVLSGLTHLRRLSIDHIIPEPGMTIPPQNYNILYEELILLSSQLERLKLKNLELDLTQFLPILSSMTKLQRLSIDDTSDEMAMVLDALWQPSSLNKLSINSSRTLLPAIGTLIERTKTINHLSISNLAPDDSESLVPSLLMNRSLAELCADHLMDQQDRLPFVVHNKSKFQAKQQSKHHHYENTLLQRMFYILQKHQVPANDDDVDPIIPPITGVSTTIPTPIQGGHSF
ncbi:hypothetical protein SAMD00019534_077520, partial [Acytostelium subglobosum LB1]|uniref:hypothetical protein n=1 Tax=Acytostelium subglobosum LB1 TaxID=1410327 RepID=UPI000644F37D